MACRLHVRKSVEEHGRQLALPTKPRTVVQELKIVPNESSVLRLEPFLAHRETRERPRPCRRVGTQHLQNSSPYAFDLEEQQTKSVSYHIMELCRRSCAGVA